MNLPRKEKQQAQQSYKIKIQSKDSKRLEKTTKDFASLMTLQKDSKDSKNHGKWQSSSTSDGLD